MTLAQQLFRLARNPLVAGVVRFGFAHFAPLLPVKRLRLTENVIVFYHPRPSWQTHILLVPRRSIPSLVALRRQDFGIIQQIFQLAGQIARDLGLDREGYTLLVNGGAYQDVGQLHFHLVAPLQILPSGCPNSTTSSSLIDTESITVFRHPHPARAVHLVIQPKRTLRNLQDLAESEIQAIIAATKQIVEEVKLLEPGFSLIANTGPGKHLCFQLVSGKRLKDNGE